MVLIWLMVRCLVWIELVLLMVMVLVVECSWLIVILVLVMVSLVVLILVVGYCWVEVMFGRVVVVVLVVRFMRILWCGSEGGLEDEECDMWYFFWVLLLDLVWVIVVLCKW